MNKTYNINLGGIPFIVNDDAFDMLKEYLSNIEIGFENETERAEIMSDIEARIADIFTQNMKNGRKVVNVSDVNYVIAQLGRPEDISGTKSKEEATTNSEQQQPKFTPEKKLYRDTENKKIGGVISGLCYYFGWGDPTWIRIGIVAFVALSVFVFHGAALFTLGVIYWILLVTVPKAKTTAEKLQMKGEPVNLQNIEKEVKEAFQNANVSAKEFSQKINDHARNMQQPTKDALDRLTKLSLSIAWGFIVFISIFLFIFAISFISGANAISSTSFNEFVKLVVKDNFRITMAAIAFTLVIIVPILYTLYKGINFFVSKEKPNSTIKKTVAAMWLAGVAISLLTLISIKKDFKYKTSQQTNYASFNTTGDTLYVNTTDHNTSFGFYFSEDEENNTPVKVVTGLEKTENGFIIGSPDFEIAVSEDSLFHIKQIVTAKGRNQKDAVNNSEYVFYNYTAKGDSLLLRNYYEIAKNGVWRKQNLKVILYIPQGKYVKFDENIDEMNAATVKGNNSFDEVLFAKKIFTVENGKIKCLNNFDDAENDFSSEEENEKEIESKDLKDVNISVNKKGVNIEGKDENGNDVKIKINDDGAYIKTTDSTGKTKTIKEKI